jgi:hypothetical protein
VGGLAVNAGVISLAPFGATPGTFTKVTVDAKGRATAGTVLSAADLPTDTHAASDIVSGALVLDVGAESSDPLVVRSNQSNLTDHTLMKVLNNGELIIAGGAGNGYRFAELLGASNPSGWSGVIKVKNPAGVTAGYLLLYSNP